MEQGSFSGLCERIYVLYLVGHVAGTRWGLSVLVFSRTLLTKRGQRKTYIIKSLQAMANVTGFSALEAIGNCVKTYVVSEEHHPSELLQVVQDAREGRETAMFCALLLTKGGKRIELQMKGKWRALVGCCGQHCRPVGGSIN